MKTLKFGIEIETVGLGWAGLAAAIQRVVGGRTEHGSNGMLVHAADGRVWSVVRDGSLSGCINGEIVSPILAYGDLETLQNLVREVRKAGARVDSSCGIHYAPRPLMRSRRCARRGSTLSQGRCDT
jgi:hypothetical protein